MDYTKPSLKWIQLTGKLGKSRVFFFVRFNHRGVETTVLFTINVLKLLLPFRPVNERCFLMLEQMKSELIHAILNTRESR